MSLPPDVRPYSMASSDGFQVNNKQQINKQLLCCTSMKTGNNKSKTIMVYAIIIIN